MEGKISLDKRELIASTRLKARILRLFQPGGPCGFEHLLKLLTLLEIMHSNFCPTFSHLLERK